MNKVLKKMDFKGTAALTFVLVGMIFLVSSGTEKSLAAPPASGGPSAQQITAEATGTCGPATNINSCLFTLKDKGIDKGRFVTEPSQSGTRVLWSTTAGGVGDEKGWVKYDVKSQAPNAVGKEVTLNFANPAIGKNSCSVAPSGMGSCNAGSGQSASFKYTIKGPE